MHNEHIELEKMINKAVDGFQMSKKKCESIFLDFDKKMKNHFSMEERAIYAISKNLDQTLQVLIRQIFSEHEIMKAQTKKIFEDMKNDRHTELSEFLSTIKRHHLLEDRSLYPKLDMNLSAEERYKFKKELQKNSK